MVEWGYSEGEEGEVEEEEVVEEEEEEGGRGKMFKEENRTG